MRRAASRSLPLPRSESLPISFMELLLFVRVHTKNVVYSVTTIRVLGGWCNCLYFSWWGRCIPERLDCLHRVTQLMSERVKIQVGPSETTCFTASVPSGNHHWQSPWVPGPTLCDRVRGAFLIPWLDSSMFKVHHHVQVSFVKQHRLVERVEANVQQQASRTHHIHTQTRTLTFFIGWKSIQLKMNQSCVSQWKHILKA